MAPIEVYVQIDPCGKDRSASALQEMQPMDVAARMISFPPVSPRDILVESENVRWRVISVAHTQRLRAVVHQELRIHAIPIGDIEFDLPLNVDLQKLTPASERNFSNYQDIEKDGDYRDIISFWGGPRGTVR